MLRKMWSMNNKDRKNNSKMEKNLNDLVHNDLGNLMIVGYFICNLNY